MTRRNTRRSIAWLAGLAAGIPGIIVVDESTSEELREDLMQRSADISRSSHESPMESRAKVEPGSGKHCVYTHFPKDPNCGFGLKTKITRASCRRRAGTVVPRAEHFGDLITANHKVLSEESESRNNHRYAVVVQDLATQWLQSYPCKTKTSQETQKSLMKFLEIWQVLWGIILESLYFNATQIRNKWDCKRAVRRVKEGTSVVLLQSGLDNEWWADSMECYW